MDPKIGFLYHTVRMISKNKTVMKRIFCVGDLDRPSSFDGSFGASTVDSRVEQSHVICVAISGRFSCFDPFGVLISHTNCAMSW